MGQLHEFTGRRLLKQSLLFHRHRVSRFRTTILHVPPFIPAMSERSPMTTESAPGASTIATSARLNVATSKVMGRHRNVHFHDTPTHTSWLNQIEIWFSILSGKSLAGASFRVVD
jgi:hypothetical protein